MLNPWLGIALMLLLLVATLVVLRGIQVWLRPHPELVRKLMHISLGLTCLTFPWVFTETWAVILLVSLSMGILASVRFVKGLRSNVGDVLGGVARRSLGEFYFAVSVAILFPLTQGRELREILYCVPLLILTVADATAALVGVRYGRLRYGTADGQKSAEGSAAFFMMAFFSVHVPLLLWTDVGRAQTLLIAVSLGLLMMLFEAIAWQGLDNLFLPLASYLILNTYLGPPPFDVAALVTRVGVLLGLVVFMFLWRPNTTLNGSGILAAAVFGYLSWAVADWKWFVPPFIVFLSYTVFSPRSPLNQRRIHNVHAVISVTAVGGLWLFLSKTLQQDFFYPYTLSFAAHLGIIALARGKRDCPQIPARSLLPVCIAKGWLFLFAPYLLMVGVTPEHVRCLIVALGGVTVAVLLFYATQPGLDDCAADLPRWLRQTGDAALGSCVGLVPLYVM